MFFGGGDDGRLTFQWPIEGGETGRLVLDLRPGEPLIASLGIVAADFAGPAEVVSRADPMFFLTVGTRAAPPGRPPGMSPFNMFFDSPAKRPHQSYRSRLDLKRVAFLRRGPRLTIRVDDLSAGPFSGELRIDASTAGPGWSTSRPS